MPETKDTESGVRKDPIRIRNGVNKCIYLSKKADKMVAQANVKFKRSDSAILSLLVERYMPRILSNKKERL